MKPKNKLCDGCGEWRVIWKNHLGNRYCKTCWLQKSAKIKVIKPTKKNVSIAPRSPNRIKQERKYTKLRKDFLYYHPLCQAHIPSICTTQSTDVHHTYAGANRDAYFLDTDTWLSVCRICHGWIHAHPKESRELEFLK
jgi:hypothetical protein